MVLKLQKDRMSALKHLRIVQEVPLNVQLTGTLANDLVVDTLSMSVVIGVKNSELNELKRV